jgi:excisionase family DNA binding protein
MADARRKTPTPADVRDKDILSPEELAVVLNIGRTLTYRLIAQKVIPSFRVGRLRRVRRSDVERYVEQQVEGTD